MIKVRKPDVIILDIFMPDMDGITVLLEIRNDEAIKDIPVVLCTGSQSDYFEGVPQGGPYTCITKPFRMPVLLEKIVKLLT